MPQQSTSTPCKLALSDGTVVTGQAIGHLGETGGELCFNTSMTGYQEIFTDPSYHGQLMMMTYPHIGNYGCSDEDMEARLPMVAGVVVRAFSHTYSNRLAPYSLSDFMKRHKLVGITGVDTRRLVRHIRDKGVMNAVISSVDLDDSSLVRRAQEWPSMDGLELASRVSIAEAYEMSGSPTGPRIAVIDYGVKQNILRMFTARGANLKVFPESTPWSDINDWQPDGIFFSNGPGDPRVMPHARQQAEAAIASGYPLFGICLGHQLLALTAGLDVFKMYVGHRGANHPVQNLQTGRVEVTTQNHGFAVDPDSLKASIATLTHVNLNDRSVEGLDFSAFNGMSVQYHPEASPGPHDSRYLFDQFLDRVSAARNQTSPTA